MFSFTGWQHNVTTKPSGQRLLLLLLLQVGRLMSRAVLAPSFPLASGVARVHAMGRSELKMAPLCMLANPIPWVHRCFSH
ncbi:hypothetical protein AOLI_G00285200 [Acnodon oligacanthus]